MSSPRKLGRRRDFQFRQMFSAFGWPAQGLGRRDRRPLAAHQVIPAGGVDDFVEFICGEFF